MGNAVIQIECEKCGSNYGYIDDDYKEGIKTTGCDDCDFKKREKYEISEHSFFHPSKSEVLRKMYRFLAEKHYEKRN